MLKASTVKLRVQPTYGSQACDPGQRQDPRGFLRVYLFPAATSPVVSVAFVLRMNAMWTLSFRKKSSPSFRFAGFAIALAILVGFKGQLAKAQQQSPAEQPVLTAYTLEDCIRIGLEKQPAVTAARASLAAAQVQQRALNKLLLTGLISREIPIRRQQSERGVIIATAAVSTAEWQAVYAVTRTYFTLQYAQKQKALAKSLIDKLKTYEEKAKFLVKQGDPDSLVTQIDVDKLTVSIELYKLKLIQATQGVERAKAALQEAMGLDPNCPLLVVEEDLPAVQTGLDRDQLICQALTRRGELVQAITAAEVVHLEVEAQKTIFGLQSQTFASGSDIHANPIPQGQQDKDYRPGAIGLEMPAHLAGHRHDRVRRIQELEVRAGAVIDKTKQLITLETIDAFHKWKEASEKITSLVNTPAKTANVVKTTKARFDIGKVNGEELIRAQTLDEQVQAELNDALFEHALALAALERITAGGFCPAYRRVMVQNP